MTLPPGHPNAFLPARSAGADEWTDVLLRAAGIGSGCLHDTWASVPSEMRDDLGFVLRECGIVAMAADIVALQKK